MQDIICPHCHKAFQVDEAGYANILQQVRDSAFEEQLHDRLALAEKEKDSALELARARAAHGYSAPEVVIAERLEAILADYAVTEGALLLNSEAASDAQ